MDRRVAMFVIAGVLIAAGVIFGNIKISSGEVNCGSAWRADHYGAQLNESMGNTGYGQDCSDARSTRKMLTFGAVGVGGLALILGIALPAEAAKQD